MNRFRLVDLSSLVGLALVAAAPTSAATPRLVATVGPGFTITLKKAGKKVTTLRAGTYTISVQDKSDFHNVHLLGPGVNKTSTVAEIATKTWTVKLRKGTYRYVCDPHVSSMKGSFTVK